MNSFYGCIYVCWSQRLNYVSYREIWLSVKAPEESLAQLKSYAKQFYKNLIYYFPGRKMVQSQQKKKHQTTGQNQQEANQSMLHKGNMGCPECVTARVLIRLGTDNSSLFKGKIQVPWNLNFSSFEALAQDPDLGPLCKIIRQRSFLFFQDH